MTHTDKRMNYPLPDHLELFDDQVRIADRGYGPLYRVRARMDFESRFFGTIFAGKTGGWVGSEVDLSSLEPGGWIGGEAEVLELATLYGQASVIGASLVSGEATIGDQSVVLGEARVFGTSCILGTSRVAGLAVVAGRAKVQDSRVGGLAVLDESARVANAHITGAARVDRPGQHVATRALTEAGDLRLDFFRGLDGIGLVRAGCWFGPLEDLETMIATDEWIETRGADCDVARPEFQAHLAAFRARMERMKGEGRW